MAVLFSALVALVVFISTSCTIAPTPVAAPVASFSGNDANGGFLGFLPDGSGHIDSGAEARYEAFLSKGYAKGLILPLPGPQDGLFHEPDGSWSIDREHLTLFGQMASRFRSGWKP